MPKKSPEPKSPLLSIVIRTYNEQKWVGETLRRLINQDFNNFEIIIVDSESTDKTLKIVKQFPIKKIIKTKKKDYTPGRSLNLGIKNSSGKFICILSAHSVPVGKSFLSIGVNTLLEDKRLCGIDGFYSALPDGSWWEKRRYLTYLWGYILGLPDFITSYDTLDNTHSIIRRSCWEKYHFDESLPSCEDYDWAQEMVRQGYGVKRLPRFFCFHSHGLTRKQENARKANWKKITKAIDKKRDKK
jgi:glycosyltransferase involved in cell wall biosynthesis